MTKLLDDDINRNDIREYIESRSDFYFELQVLYYLKELGLTCHHGGLYQDPITNKTREYDIRAFKKIKHYQLAFSVECKNVKSNFPVVTLRVPRPRHESFHEVIVSAPKRGLTPIMAPPFEIFRFTEKFSFYSENDAVGKNIVQVGRSTQGSLVGNDSEIFEKWGQCLSSLSDVLIETSLEIGSIEPIPAHIGSVIPIVVVPDGCLWSIDFDLEGRRLTEPTLIERCPFYVGKDYRYRVGSIEESKFTVSHVEIMTLNGIKSFIKKCTNEAEYIKAFFSSDGIEEARKARNKQK
jgi:hypothetical protein